MTRRTLLCLTLLAAALLTGCVTEPGPDVPMVYGRATKPPKPGKAKVSRDKKRGAEVQTESNEPL